MTLSTALSRLVIVIALATAVAAAGCGDDEGDKGGSETAKPLELRGISASDYSGPPPLKSSFTAKARNAKGEVLYRWRFDDGSTSYEQNPSHSFKTPGWYIVIVDARDESGQYARQTLLMGVQSRLKKGQQAPRLTQNSVKAAQEIQGTRMLRRLTGLYREARAREAAAKAL